MTKNKDETKANHMSNVPQICNQSPVTNHELLITNHELQIHNPKSEISNHKSRDTSARLLKIRQLIASGTFPNAGTLAAELSVSRRTIKRDITWMKTWWELPIAYDRRRHGFFYTEPVDQLPGVPGLTEHEISALFFVHKAAEHYHGTSLHAPIQMLLQKFTAHLDRTVRYSLHDLESALSFRPFAPEVIDNARFEAVTRGLQQSLKLTFDYQKPDGDPVESRCVRPLHLTCADNLWYLIGYDENRSEERTFALARMCGPVQLGDKFQNDRNFNLDKYLRGSFSVLKGDGDFEVILEFDRWSAAMLHGRTWHSSQKITPLTNGGCHLKMRLTALAEVERWVLSWGTHVKVLSPVSLRDRLRAIISELSKSYSSVAAPKLPNEGGASVS